MNYIPQETDPDWMYKGGIKFDRPKPTPDRSSSNYHWSNVLVFWLFVAAMITLFVVTIYHSI